MLGLWYIAEFPANAGNIENYYVADVTQEGELMVVGSHGANPSNLYMSDVVSPYEVEITRYPGI